MNPVWKLNFFLFNIEGYGEFFSGITPTYTNKKEGGRPGIQKLIMKIIDGNVGKSISIASIWTYPKLVFLNYLCLYLFTT